MSDFYKYFKENMEGLNLPAPESLFGTLQMAVASTTAILTQIDKFGKAVTISELIGAGTKLEVLTMIGACSAAYYVGAVIGSITVATGRSLPWSISISDVFFAASKHNLNRPWLFSTIQRYPGLYDKRVIARNTYRFHAVIV